MKKKTLINPRKLTVADLKKVVGGLPGNYIETTTMSIFFQGGECTNIQV